MNPGIDALLSRAGELIRERTDLAARMRTIDTDVATLKRAAEIMSSGTAPPAAIPCAPRKNGSEHAGLTQAMLEVLRDAPTPLTAAEVGTMAMERIGQDATSIPRSALTSKATTALSRYSKRGTVQRIEEPDGPLRWRVAR